MKEIRAYIQPFMLQKVTDALHKVHVRGMSVSDIKGFGREKDESLSARAADQLADFFPKARIEIICNDEEAETIIQAIQKAAHTGRKGDGKIVVLDVQETVSISTGERGTRAV